VRLHKIMTHPLLTPRRERWLLLTIAGIQFTHILDFMIMMPLGPQFTRLFAISDAQFGLLVSAYTLAAGVSAWPQPPTWTVLTASTCCSRCMCCLPWQRWPAGWRRATDF
jgi:predicted MFS family arabinose efflux permease